MGMGTRRGGGGGGGGRRGSLVELVELVDVGERRMQDVGRSLVVESC